MKKFLFLVTVIASFLTACESDDFISSRNYVEDHHFSEDSLTNAVLSTFVKVSLVPNDSTGGYDSITYMYKRNKIILKKGPDFVAKYGYKDDNITEIFTYNLLGDMVLREFYDYNENNQLTMYTKIESDVQDYEQTIYTYLDDNNVKYVHMVLDGLTDLIINSNTGTLHYEFGRLIKKISNSNHSIDTFNTISYDYDEYNSPFVNVLGYQSLLNLESESSGYNLIKKTETATINSQVFSETVTRYMNSYNENFFLIKTAIEIFPSASSTKPIYQTTEFHKY